MKSIYDIIKEGLLDDEDVWMDRIEKNVGESWFEENAQGNFKIKNKKSSLGPTLVGKVIIDGFQGETLPIQIWTIKGDLYINNCPNLKTLNGFFGERPISIEGGLYIENCPNLENLNGLPPIVDDFSLVGNKKIKSLEGAPKHVFGNCYIVKNGKRFSEEYIRSMIEISQRVVCSEDEIEANITEALNEPHLLELAEYLKSKGTSFKKILGDEFRMSLDKITSKDVEVYRWPKNIDDGVKAANQIISGRKNGFVVLMNAENEYDYIIYGKNLINLDRWSYFGSSYMTKSTNLINKCKNAHEIIVFYSNGFETQNLKWERINARIGMITNTEEQNRQIARENVERYKKLVAKMRADKDKDFEEIDKQVENIVMRVLKASQISHRDPNKIDSYKISSLNEWIYDQTRWDSRSHNTYGKDGLLRVYSKYTEYFQDVRKGSAYDYQIRELKSCKEKLIDIIKKIDTELKLLGL